MKPTAMIIFGSLLVVLMYDLWVIIAAGGDSTVSVSQFVADFSARPRVAFVCGVVVCHLFGWMMFPRIKNDGR